MCDVKYKRILPGLDFPQGFTTIKRAVQRLVVIVPNEETVE